MKNFPKKLYITRNEEGTEYFVDEDQSFIRDEKPDTEVAVYQLVRVGVIEKKSKLVFEKE